MLKQCEHCGKFYTPAHNNQKYCDPDCGYEERDAARKKKELDRYHANKELYAAKRRASYRRKMNRLRRETA